MANYKSTARTGEVVGANTEFFTCITLVDITDTGIYDHLSGKLYEQAQNLNALLQAISLGSQPTLSSIETITGADMSEYDFGSTFTGVHTVWVLRFASERAGSITIANLQRDIDGIPIYNGLDETALFSSNVFETNSSLYTNIYFIRNDNL